MRIVKSVPQSNAKRIRADKNKPLRVQTSYSVTSIPPAMIEAPTCSFTQNLPRSSTPPDYVQYSRGVIRSTVATLFTQCLFLTLFLCQILTVRGQERIVLRDNTIKGLSLATRVLPNLHGDHLTFSFLQTKATDYFKLDNRTGQLHSARDIDRDYLCAEADLCCPPQMDGRSSHNTYQEYDICTRSRSSTGPAPPVCTFNLSVSVASALGQFPDVHEITIVICEENDHAPEFKIPKTDSHGVTSWNKHANVEVFHREPTMYTINVSESVPVGHRIRLPLAEDIDAPPYQVQRYELEPLEGGANGAHNLARLSDGPFKLEPIWENAATLNKGIEESRGAIVGLELVLTEPLDRETVAVHNYRVLAIDGGSPPLTGTLQLVVRVTDTNDHAPQFTQLVYEKAVDEGVVGKKVLKVSATDEDEGPNAVIIYEWPEGSAWNDLPPSKDGAQSAARREPVTKDELANAPPGYWFRLDRETGAIYVRRPLDYEIKPQHKFQILAHNPIIPSNHVPTRPSQIHRTMTATANVIINVHNLDDEAPHIVIDYVNGDRREFKEIRENVPSPYFIAFVTVSDPDLTIDQTNRLGVYVHENNGPFIDASAITCHLDSHLDAYRLDRKGEVRTAKQMEIRYTLSTSRPLDREQSAEDHIRIVCQDSGSPPKTATAVAVVKLLDENDCTPEIQVLSTQNKHGLLQTPIEPWPPSKLHQWIENQRDSTSLIRSPLAAACEANVSIYTIHVAENQPAGTVFARLRATDKDAGENGRVTFEIPKSSSFLNATHSLNCGLPDYSSNHFGKVEISSTAGALEYFKVDETRGDLSTLRLIDREEGYSIMEDMFLVVKVTDHGIPFQRAAWILLHIVILDENDNPPFFVEPKMQFSIQENLPAPAVVGEVRVIDPDIQPIGAIDYDRMPTIYEAESAYDRSIDPLVKRYPTFHRHRLQLRIDPGHGRRDLPFILYRTTEGRFFLNTTRSLDRESEEAFQFGIIATDTDAIQIHSFNDGRKSPTNQGHTATATVIINVIDVNDNQPEIIFPIPGTSNSTVHRVSYRERAGYEIVSINANDRDAGQSNGKYYFELVPDLRSEYLFEIDRATGLLRTRRRLTKEDLGDYKLQIVVRDEGTPPLETHLTLRLVVDQSEPHGQYDPRPGEAYPSPRSLFDTDVDGPGYARKRLVDGYHSELGQDGALGLAPSRVLPADIMLFVIIALILGLICAMLGLCMYLRHKRNLFQFLPDICGLCSLRSGIRSNRTGQAEAKSPYMKNYLDLERRNPTHDKFSSPPEPDAMSTLLGSPGDSEQQRTMKQRTAAQMKLDLLRPTSPSNDSPFQNRELPLPQYQRQPSQQVYPTHFQSSYNVNSPYSPQNYGPQESGFIEDLRMPFSPALMGTECAFPSILSTYRPGTTLAVNIPDVADQAETLRKHYMGYCRTGNPCGDLGAGGMEVQVNPLGFADSGVVPLNAYDIGHFQGNTGRQRYFNPVNSSQQGAYISPGNPEHCSELNFRPIQDDFHLYQRIYPGEQQYGVEQNRSDRPQRPLSKPQHTAFMTTGRVNNGDNRYNTTSAKKHMDAGKSAGDNVSLSQWRSDPSLNQMATGVNGLELQSTNLVQSKTCDPYKPVLNGQSLKRSNSNKHPNRMRKKQLTSAPYYSALHDPLKPTQTPSLAPRSLTKPILANPSVPTLLSDDQPREETVENYAISFPKVQASFV
ncbi:unnamed protein product [Calicophoron daubneyi]|uniref:Cadherin domain-containing protein n=1 Tax=Calicophoron daubneyi TaxID=300641 RepID=A0AAV2T1B1_CALDB